MFTWPVAVFVLLGVLWWVALTFGRVLMDDDEIAMREWEAARDRFDELFE